MMIKRGIRLEENYKSVISFQSDDCVFLVDDKLIPLYQDNKFRQFLFSLSFCFMIFIIYYG